MDKKHHNWLGWILILLYIAIFIGLFFLASIFDPNTGIPSFIGIICGIWFFISIYLGYFTWYKTWCFILPEKIENATLIAKYKTRKKIRSSYGPHIIVKSILTFQFSNGIIKNFTVSKSIYNSTDIYLSGKLLYKEYENKLFFVKFEPDSPKDGAY